MMFMNTTEGTKKIKGKNYNQEGNSKKTEDLNYVSNIIATSNLQSSLYEEPATMNTKRNKLINYTNSLNKNSKDIMSFLNLSDVEKRTNKNQGEQLL